MKDARAYSVESKELAPAQMQPLSFSKPLEQIAALGPWEFLLPLEERTSSDIPHLHQRALAPIQRANTQTISSNRQQQEEQAQPNGKGALRKPTKSRQNIPNHSENRENSN